MGDKYTRTPQQQYLGNHEDISSHARVHEQGDVGGVEELDGVFALLSVVLVLDSHLHSPCLEIGYQQAHNNRHDHGEDAAISIAPPAVYDHMHVNQLNSRFSQIYYGAVLSDRQSFSGARCT
jgi:hypothetical protein